jgi:hypothetical protein
MNKNIFAIFFSFFVGLNLNADDRNVNYSDEAMKTEGQKTFEEVYERIKANEKYLDEKSKAEKKAALIDDCNHIVWRIFHLRVVRDLLKSDISRESKEKLYRKNWNVGDNDLSKRQESDFVAQAVSTLSAYEEDFKQCLEVRSELSIKKDDYPFDIVN